MCSSNGAEWYVQTSLLFGSDRVWSLFVERAHTIVQERKKRETESEKERREKISFSAPTQKKAKRKKTIANGSFDAVVSIRRRYYFSCLQVRKRKKKEKVTDAVLLQLNK